MTAAISDETDIGVGWNVHEQIERAMNEEKSVEKEWAVRSASRVRQFVPEPPHIPRHRADVTPR